MKKKKYDFSGYATKANLLCSDGRIITKDAFKEQDGAKVPLVFQHIHNDPENILGYGILEHRDEGMYLYASFNGTPKAQHAKEAVEHGDIEALSIFANQVQQNGNQVMHGKIREVSLVYAGANPGARIENIEIEHSDGSLTESEDEVVICCGDIIVCHEETEDENGINTETGTDNAEVTTENQNGTKAEEEPKETVEEKNENDIEHAEDKEDDKDKEEPFDFEKVFNSLTDEQKTLFYLLIAKTEQDAKEESKIKHTEEGEDTTMKETIFEKFEEKAANNGVTLTHDQLSTIFADAKKNGSLKESVIAHSVEYGIENIDYLFPDAKAVMDQPAMISRRTEWVNDFLNAVRKVPFAKIKSLAADITADEARAKGYIKGNLKKEEVIKLLKRETLPTTIYKKQKLDKDDLDDIVDFNVVALLWGEMRLMLEEEMARAALVGDGRDPETEANDKIDEEKIRPIYTDDDLYAHHVFVDNAMDVDGFIDEVVMQKKNYKRGGMPTMYCTQDLLSGMLLLKDQVGRRIYANKAELATAMGVKDIVPVEVMENRTREVDEVGTTQLMAIVVNPGDYVMGANRGGQLNRFDQFDIDYNQYKYLIEGRCSGALVYPKSALVFERVTVPATV